MINVVKFKFWIDCRHPLPLEEEFGLEELGVSLEQWKRMPQDERDERLNEYAKERKNDWIEFGATEAPSVKIVVPVDRPLKYSQAVHVSGELFSVSEFLRIAEKSAQEVNQSKDSNIYREAYISFLLPDVNHLVAGEVYGICNGVDQMRIELKRARPLPDQLLWTAGVVHANESELQALDARIHVSKEMLWEQKNYM